MGQERRENPRYSARLAVKFESKEAFIEGCSLDISKGGIFVETERPLEYGDIVQLQIFVLGQAGPIEIEGSVAYSDAEKRSPNGMGIEFVEFRNQGKERLQSLIAELSAQQ